MEDIASRLSSSLCFQQASKNSIHELLETKNGRQISLYGECREERMHNTAKLEVNDLPS